MVSNLFLFSSSLCAIELQFMHAALKESEKCEGIQY